MCEYCQKQTKSKQAKTGCVPKRSLHILSLFFICCLTFGTLGISSSSLYMSQDVKNVVSSWVPKTDLGKLKFVLNQTDEEVFSHVSYLSMPFENTYITQETNGSFLVNGLGGMVVKSCLKGKVSLIEGDKTKTIHISHGKGLSSIYSNIDNVGVKVGDIVEKNSPIGVSEKSVINFQLLFRNKPISGLVVKDGEMSFS